MPYRVFCILLNFIIFLYLTSGDSITKKNDKRPELNLQVCVQSFDIHKDKIIRTEDSRQLGAKYLNEIDLDSREECLKLCCETDQCDVFVFEEKRPGSCYLFHCGPPNDFKCKFTSHANYSSAVLNSNRNGPSTAELEEQIRRTQQEHELESLRKLADPPSIEYTVSESTAILAITQTPKSLVITTPISKKEGCSRNQFECRTSGDCIAIYNACDGVPQCADASDEAAELGCPTERPTVASPLLQQPLPLSSPDSMKWQMMQHHKSLVPSYTHGQERDSKTWQSSGSPRQGVPPPQNIQYPVQQVVMPQPQLNIGSQGYQWEYQPLYEQNKAAYAAINTFHGQNNLNPYEMEQSHIFNHKGPGVIGENGAESGVYIDANRQYAPYFPSPNHGMWQEGQPQPPPAPSAIPNSLHSQSIAQHESLENTASPPPCKPSTNEEEIPSRTNPRTDTDVKTQKAVYIEKSNDHADKKSNSISKNQGNSNYVKTLETQVVEHEKKSKITEDNHKELEKSHMVAEHLQHINSDSKVLRPRGAVISLALGLTATAMMAALIACRLRVVRRRGRRGHGPYAHDADYLVNGMYL
ncbi:uncharacterized protein LOC107264751 [Cephus cinctus]|uniref:Uncharacterized protein LOC107264751 n=1 Tax=Cephus cinctus TaxID=211228 RepID=A0AAJ7BL68_CEPCN|nr:uncharacterized protein LOC107264751 [Cephus cinctus]